MFNNQGTSKPEVSQKENGDMAWACCEELVELDDVQLATVVGGGGKKKIGPISRKPHQEWWWVVGDYFRRMGTSTGVGL